MEIWLDTINLETVQEAAYLGLCSGVTTNPAILSHAEQVYETLSKLLKLQKGKVAVQVTSTSHQEMIEEGKQLFEFSERILVKVPVNREGLIAIRQLCLENIPVLGTAVLHPKQAFLAAKLGAMYVAPYLSHMGYDGADPFSALQTMQDLFHAQSFKTKIMAASIKQLDHLIRCAQMGLRAVTIKDELFAQLIDNHPHSETFTLKFNEQWSSAFEQASIADLLNSKS